MNRLVTYRNTPEGSQHHCKVIASIQCDVDTTLQVKRRTKAIKHIASIFQGFSIISGNFSNLPPAMRGLVNGENKAIRKQRKRMF